MNRDWLSKDDNLTGQSPMDEDDEIISNVSDVHWVPSLEDNETTDPKNVSSYTSDDEYVQSEGGQDGGSSGDGETDDSSSTSESSRSQSAETSRKKSEQEEKGEAPVGVKEHKKFNAVGDPDGEGSDDESDDDDDDDDEEEVDLDEWDDYDKEVSDIDMMLDAAAAQVQVELELVDGIENTEEEETSTASTSSGRRSASGGGVSVRLGQRLGRKNRNSETRSSSSAEKILEDHVLEAWKPYIYIPPSASGRAYMADHARSIDGDSKVRLDRRTLYGGLMLEWLQVSSNHRMFFDKITSQKLQAALSLATQPWWRKSLPRPNGVRFYEDSNDAERGCTLAMQETIAMALAHSLGVGMVILDDKVLESIREKLVASGYNEEQVKPAVLIQSLFKLAEQGEPLKDSHGLISTCMNQDLSLGMDDPFDERAVSSCQEMIEWEKKWRVDNDEGDAEKKEERLPLLIFIRVGTSQSLLLKSKSAIDALVQECKSNTSNNLIVLGRGIDGTTESVPQDPAMESQDNFEGTGMGPGAMQGGTPWFGFPQHNLNASGQNDPEGSRRFNIFLARTVDANGTLGILGAIAPPQAGNLFPEMMAMQARERANQEGGPSRADMERWVQMLQKQEGASALPPPQFFNATLSASGSGSGTDTPGIPQNAPPPSPEVIQQTLEHAMSQLLDRLAQMNADGEGASELSPDLHKAFAQVLRNDNLRRGIAENLARAAPSLSDPKCQGVMLSVYVPPLPPSMNRGRQPGSPQQGSWFQKISNNQEDTSAANSEDENAQRKQKRVRTMAAAAAVLAAQKAQEAKQDEKKENKTDRNLSRLEEVCQPIVLKTPTDPVRAKSWNGWIGRERGAVIFRRNRRVLNEKLEKHFLSLQEHTGTRGAGSSLRQMLSTRDISHDMDEVIKCAIELEAAKSQRLHELPEETHEKEMDLAVDITLNQLLLTDDGLIENSEEVIGASEQESKKAESKGGVQFLHPSSLETALSLVCRISPSPTGGLSVPSTPASHRSKEEIMALAQDKHERALVSQVVSPQDIGVTYDMIGGLTDVKELLRQSITYPLKFPHLYSEGIAREAVKGVLLFGPPGTGKTMLAKAVATEGGASFLSVDASSVENKWLGESEKNAKAVFTLARRLAPCVIFIDEVDSLLSSREGTSDDSAHGTLTSVKTTLMSEWDGLNSGTNGVGEAGSDRVIVIGSTNRPFDLDEAVLRRFPRRILVDLPNLESRKEILEVTLAENRIDPKVNLTQIAERLEGYTGSDIKEVAREAVVQISHEQARLLDLGFANTVGDRTQGSLQRLRPVTTEDFEKALQKLTRSVSEKGRELGQVYEWNDEYGEIKKEKRNRLPHLANMYL